MCAVRRLTLTVVWVLVLWSPVAAAPTTSEQKCAAGKLDATTKAVAAKLACYRRAVLDAAAVNPVCLADVDSELVITFGKLERMGGCTVTGDVATYLVSINIFVDAVVSALDPLFCGDTAGPGGIDVPCSCGDSVTTDTTLTVSDPVTTTTCGGGGLRVQEGVTLNLGGQVLTGNGSDIGLTALDDSVLSNGTVRGFGTGVSVSRGTVTITDVAADGNAGSGLVVGPADGGAAPIVIFNGSRASVSDNGGSGVVLHSGAKLTMMAAGTPPSDFSPLPVLNNAGVGIDVRGELRAVGVKVAGSASHGVLVESDSPVELQDCDVRDSGRHLLSTASDRVGIYARRASHERGLLVHGIAGRVRDNTGHGIVLGHFTEQTGVVFGHIGEQQIFGNEIGILVRQKDTSASRTMSTILNNNVYNNRGSGIYMSTSYQRSLPLADRRTIAGNDVHHNAVSSPACTVATGAVQTAGQIVFDGPVAGTDPSIATSGPDIGPDQFEYPDDFRCFWGATPGTAPIQTEAECNNVNNPAPPFFDLSGGVNNHCIWTGSNCRLAWEAGGTENTGACDSARNRIWNYVNNVTQIQVTQRGIAAINGARVRARRNVWGAGGSASGTAVDSNPVSDVDADNPCPGTETSCVGYDEVLP